MIRKIVATLILLPLGLLIVALAVANREIVTISFDPFSAVNPAFALKIPLFLLMFVLLISGVIIGGIAAWIKQGRLRRAARRLADDLRAAQAEADRLRRRLAANETLRQPAPPAALRPPAA